MLLLDKLDEPSQRLWYAAKAVENGWSRKVLDAQIRTHIHYGEVRSNGDT
jgi:predicted nuclease of restriction endonuclease-like (RecB) superfamily